jgi:uncharacterized glyoxalase superfamily protein PhnB
MEASLAFYRSLGVQIDDGAVWSTASGIHHIEVTLPSGIILHIDSIALADQYDAGWRAHQPSGPSIILSFKVADRADVDSTHARMTGLGYDSAQRPYDAFWGARYAILIDPDGNHVGVMSPSDPDRATRPPTL